MIELQNQTLTSVDFDFKLFRVVATLVIPKYYYLPIKMFKTAEEFLIKDIAACLHAPQKDSPKFGKVRPHRDHPLFRQQLRRLRVQAEVEEAKVEHVAQLIAMAHSRPLDAQ